MPSLKLTDLACQSAKVPSVEEGQCEIWDSVLPGFGLRLNPGGRKSFVLMVRVRGLGIQRRITIGTFPHMSLASARKQARQHIESAQAGIDPREAIEAEKQARARAKQHKERRSRWTFGKIAEDFIKDYARVNAPR